MKNRNQNLLVIFAFFLIFHLHSTVFAQGTAFTYSGLLQQNSAPQSGTFNFMFTLYDAASGGTRVAGPITLNGVAVKTGAFTVTLDFGAAVWNGQANWLEIAVEANGNSTFYTLTPRQQMFPTPYAIYAESANTLSSTLTFSQLSGTVNNNQLANSSLTVNAGTGLTGGGTVSLGGSTTLSVAPGSVDNSMLANNSITVNAGTGMNGGGPVALGGTITLNNAGVTSLAGSDGVTVSAGTGDLSLGLGSTLTLPNVPVTVNSGVNLLMYADNSYNYFAGLQTGNTTMSGFGNTGLGDSTLVQNTFGNDNTAVGFASLHYNILGGQNVALGLGALQDPTNGSCNVAVGDAALASLGAYPYSGGSNNIAVGFMSGANFNANESYNIDIGNRGVAGENNITRIGTTQTAAYIAGIIYGNGSGLVNLSASQITGGTINNSQLANSTINILPGLGLSGGGSIPLGGSTTLNNTGVITLTGGGGVTVSANSGAVTLGSTATSANTPNTIVSRDGTGSFSAQNLTLAGILNLPAPPVTINSGASSLLLGDGHTNLFVGLAAGNSTMTGGENTGLGFESLQADTTGYQNTAVGAHSLAANTTGIQNVAAGYLSLLKNTTGFGNTACGWESLAANTNGWYDTALGLWALQVNTTGDNNTAAGYDALGGNTTGTENTAFGVHANLNNTTGSNNVAVGYWSLNNVTTGVSNIAVGYKAGINFSSTESGNIDIGNPGVVGDNDIIRIGTPGIHVTTSLAGICNSHVGYGCLQGTAGTTFGNTFNFWWAGSQLQAWVDNIDIGVVQVTSDRRLKENIEPMTDDALTRVLALKPSTFKYKNIPGTIFQGDGTKEEGFIADELQQVIPSAVNGKKDAVTSSGDIQPQTVNLAPVVAVLTKAVQEQQQEINELKAMVKTLSAQR